VNGKWSAYQHVAYKHTNAEPHPVTRPVRPGFTSRRRWTSSTLMTSRPGATPSPHRSGKRQTVASSPARKRRGLTRRRRGLRRGC